VIGVNDLLWCAGVCDFVCEFIDFIIVYFVGVCVCVCVICVCDLCV